MKKTARTYVFDVDGVVVESWGFARALRDQFGLTKEHTEEFFSGPFQDCLTGDRLLYSALPEYLKAWSWELTIDDFISLWMTSDNRPDGSVLKLVGRLRSSGHLCHIASNQEVTRARYLQEEMGFSDLFDDFHFSCDLGVRKPLTEFFVRTHRRLGVPKSQVYFWDDELKNVHAASRFGWNAFLFQGVQSITDVA